MRKKIDKGVNMKYLIRKEYADGRKWWEVKVYHRNREDCFKDARVSSWDRDIRRIEVYEWIDPEIWKKSVDK